MINFKKAICNEQKESNKNIKEYNDIIVENLKGVKDLFNYNIYKVSLERGIFNTVDLKLVKETETAKQEHKFNCFNQLEKMKSINKNTHIDVKGFVESKLEKFIANKFIKFGLTLVDTVLIIVKDKRDIQTIYYDISYRYQFDSAHKFSNWATMKLTFSGSEITIIHSDDKKLMDLHTWGNVVLYHGDFTEEEIRDNIEWRCIEQDGEKMIKPYEIGMDMIEFN